ncbi:MAG: type I-C CRISPR-associated protein Cas8c/Csd1 [Syntrophobacter sp.]
MFSDLVTLANQLREEGQLPPEGYVRLSDPIRWTVNLFRGDPPKVHLEETKIFRPRPISSKRTSNVLPYPLVDTAAYVFGIKKGSRGSVDERAGEKHLKFVALIDEILDWSTDSDFRKILRILSRVIKDGSTENDPRFSEIMAEHCVSFFWNIGDNGGYHLFEHPECVSFWKDHLFRAVSGGSNEEEGDEGECGICGKSAHLIKNLPSKVKILNARRQILSFNQDAFPSYVRSKDEAHLEICFRCGEEGVKGLDFLLNNKVHHQTLVLDKLASGRVRRDTLQNQVAVFWLGQPRNVVFDGEEVDLLAMLSMPLRPETGKDQPEVTLSLIERFLKVPWHAENAALTFPNDHLFLGILSPNGPGRIAVRDWMALDVSKLKGYLSKYIEALKIVGPLGEPPKAVTIYDLLEALWARDVIHKAPKLARGLLKFAYCGGVPPTGILEAALNRIRKCRWKIASRRRRGETPERLHALASAIKMSLTFGNCNEESKMEALNREYADPAYLSGRLLSALEEVQRRASGTGLSVTIVDRNYSAASTSPSTTLVRLLKLARTAHLPKLKKRNLGYGQMIDLIQEIMSLIDARDALPLTLNLHEQAKFALGYYHQRAGLLERTSKETKKEVTQ